MKAAQHVFAQQPGDNLFDVLGLVVMSRVNQNLRLRPSRTGQQQRTPEHQHGADIGAVADETLVSPPLNVGMTAPFTIAFDHQYSFEAGPVVPPTGPDVYFDGGVLELSDAATADIEGVQGRRAA